MRPYSPHFQEHYWSGGAAEKTHVFLHGNRLPERFAQATAFTVAELGFGTGLTLLLTLQLWQRAAPPQAKLSYISYELHPLPLNELQAIHATLPESLQPLATQLHAVYAPQPGWNLWPLGVATLHLYVGPAASGLTTQPCKADAWFLDGFSPARNPDMWQPELLARAAALTNPGGTAATYSVARVVRSNLAAAGFVVEKTTGHPPKRHMLTAVLAA